MLDDARIILGRVAAFLGVFRLAAVLPVLVLMATVLCSLIVPVRSRQLVLASTSRLRIFRPVLPLSAPLSVRTDTWTGLRRFSGPGVVDVLLRGAMVGVA